MSKILRPIVLGIILIAMGTSAQADEWYNVEVVETGIDKGGKVQVRLTDLGPKGEDFVRKWFQLPAKSKKEMLAISLSAISAALPLRVRVDLQQEGAPIIKVMYLQSE